MNKKNFFLLGFCFVLLACSMRKGEEEKKNISIQATTTDLPNIELAKSTGERFGGKDLLGKNAILILFQPDCDHCQRAAKQIKEHIQSFSHYQLYFITNAPVVETTKFAKDYKLSEEPNVVFAVTDVSSILSNFGSIPTPSLYIYDSAGKLIQKFNGETDINLILKAL